MYSGKLRSTFHYYLNFCGEKKDDGVIDPFTLYLLDFIISIANFPLAAAIGSPPPV